MNSMNYKICKTIGSNNRKNIKKYEKFYMVSCFYCIIKKKSGENTGAFCRILFSKTVSGKARQYELGSIVIR